MALIEEDLSVWENKSLKQENTVLFAVISTMAAILPVLC